MQVSQADQLVLFNKSVSQIDTIEASLQDYKYKRAQDMISAIKDAIYEIMLLGQNKTELYPALSNVIQQTNKLIDGAKLQDKSVFSQIRVAQKPDPAASNN